MPVGARSPPSVGYADISPTKGEIGWNAITRHTGNEVSASFRETAGRSRLISPLVGEMSAEPTEGGLAPNSEAK